MGWQFDAKQPLYLQIMRHIKRAIVTGEYKPGARIPAVRELAASAGVNPNTMQRALAELETAGFLESQRTAGRFVTKDASKIAVLQQDIAKELTCDFVFEMHGIGFGDKKTIEFVQQAQKEAQHE